MSSEQLNASSDHASPPPSPPRGFPSLPPSRDELRLSRVNNPNDGATANAEGSPLLLSLGERLKPVDDSVSSSRNASRAHIKENIDAGFKSAPTSKHQPSNDDENAYGSDERTENQLPALNENMIGILNQLLTEFKKQSDRQEKRLEEHTTILKQMNDRQAQQDLTSQPIPQISMDNASVWDPLHKSLMNNIGPTLDKWRGGLDTLLVFVGLFSGIVTSFLVDSFDQLQPDPVDRTNELLANLTDIIVLLGRGNTTQFVWNQPSEFTPDPDNVRLNVYWALSLVIALTAAALAVLARGFIARLILPDGTARSKVIDLYQRWPNAQKTFGPLMSWLPLTLIMPVALFIVGLLDALISSAVQLQKPNVALIIMSVLGCIIVTLAVCMGISAMIHGTLHPNASPFKIQIPFIREWSHRLDQWMDFASEPQSPTIASQLTTRIPAVKEIAAFHSSISRTYEDTLLDSAAGALESLLNSSYLDKSCGTYSTMIHLLSAEASVRCNITVVTAFYGRHIASAGSQIAGLPLSQSHAKELLQAILACIRRNPRLLSVCCSLHDKTPIFPAAAAIVLVYYIDYSDFAVHDIGEAFDGLSKALIEPANSITSPLSQFGLSYILAASARMIVNLWQHTYSQLEIGNDADFYMSNQLESINMQTRFILLSAHALQWQVNVKFNHLIDYLQNNMHDLLTSIQEDMARGKLKNSRPLNSSGHLMALLLGTLFWRNDKKTLSANCWRYILDWIVDQMDARVDSSKLDCVIEMENAIVVESHISYAERMSYLAIRRTHSQFVSSQVAVRLCCQVLNMTWKPFQQIKYFSGRPFQDLLSSSQDSFDEALKTFVQTWNFNKDMIENNTQLRMQADKAYENVYTSLFIALNHGLNTVHWYEEWNKADFLYVVMDKVLILSHLESNRQTNLNFTLSALSIQAVLTDSAWNKYAEARFTQFSSLVDQFALHVDGFINDYTDPQHGIQLPLQGDILYALHDKGTMDANVIVSKAMIRLHDHISTCSDGVGLLLNDNPELCQTIKELYGKYKGWVHKALEYKD